MPQNKTTLPPIGAEVPQTLPGIGEEVLPQSVDTAEPRAQQRTIGGFASNAAGSFYKNVKQGVQGAAEVGKFLALSPKYIAEAVVNAVSGNAPVSAETVDTIKSIPASVWSGAVQKYGSWEKFKDTLYNDPFAVLADVATLTPAGTANKLSQMGRLGKLAGAAVKYSDPMTASLGATTGVTSWGLNKGGRILQGRSVRPSLAVLDKMAESRGMTPKELGLYLGDVSNKHNLPPTGQSVRALVDKVNENTAAQRGMEGAASEAGNVANMRDIAASTNRNVLGYTKDGAVIPKIQATTRPNADIRATKAAVAETFQQHPQMSVPFETWRGSTVPGEVIAETLPIPKAMPPANDPFAHRLAVAQNKSDGLVGEPMLQGVSFDLKNRTPKVRVPNPELDPRVLGDVVRQTNATLVDAFGIDAASKAGINVDKAFASNATRRLDEITTGFEPTSGRLAGMSRSEIGKDTHELLNLLDALRQRTTTTQTNPVRLYEAMGVIMGSPEALAMGLASRPPVQWKVGRGMRQMSDFASGLNTPDVARALLLARMQQEAVKQE